MPEALYKKIDWVIAGIWLLLVVFGWMNIFASSVSEDGFVFSLKEKYIMDLIWVATALTLGILILFVIPSNLYPTIALPFYGLMVLLLVAVAFVGVEVNGSKSWFALGPFRLQPAEFSKIATALLLAQVMSKYGFSFSKFRDTLRVAVVLALPMLAILLEKETGSALVYLGYLLVCYREGMTGWLLVIGLLAIVFFIVTLVFSPFVAILVLLALTGIACSFHVRKPLQGGLITALGVALLVFLPRLMQLEAFSFLNRFEPEMWLALLSGAAALTLAVVFWFRRQRELRNLMLGFLLGLLLIFSVEFVFTKVLKEHQRARIEVLLGIKEDPMGVGYNVHQSLVAIGSGGLSGKGFLGGTQTRFDFVPEQSTDFIFCTIGEEWGLIGTLAVLAVYLVLILRLIATAEKQKDHFARIYGWCVACCLLMHVVINICMTIGLMPVIGIPLPMLSYGGSSLWAFTILIFIFLRLDLDQKKYQ
ncbi:MAG: rod shape-determining protein RodA [Bacteroidales bacterium]|nr:rod shape-determining protein RodA [Bacteroidales bacterium]